MLLRRMADEAEVDARPPGLPATRRSLRADMASGRQRAHRLRRKAESCLPSELIPHYLEIPSKEALVALPFDLQARHDNFQERFKNLGVITVVWYNDP